MRYIKAKFNSTCIETGRVIKKGEEVLYNPKTKKVYHRLSKRFENQPIIDAIIETDLYRKKRKSEGNDQTELFI